MIKQFFIVVIVLFVSIGCNRIDKPEKPDNLIDKNKMAAVLYDVFIINAAKGTDKFLLEKNGVLPEDYIFKKYNIDSLQFTTSNNYYAYDIKTYEGIINDVEARIKANKEVYQEKLNNETKRQNKKKDSLKRLGDSLKQSVNDIELSKIEE